MKKQNRKSLVKKADRALSNYVRKLWGRCFLGCGPAECAFHFITRSKYAIRWDLRNVVASCFAANFRHEFQPHIAYRWFLKKYGQDSFDELIRDGNKIAKFSNSDLKEIAEKYENLLANICQGARR